MHIKVIFFFLLVSVACSCAGDGQRRVPLEPPTNGSSKANQLQIDGLVRVGDSPRVDSPAVTIQCIDGQTCWINTPRLLWRSVDAGKNWQEIYGASQNEHIEACDLVTSTMGWLISFGKLLVTYDGGLTWTEKLSPLNYPNGEIRSLWFFKDGQTGWLAGGTYRPQTAEESKFGVPPNTKDATGKGVLQEAIYRTTDGGNSWKKQPMHSLIGRIMQVRFVNKDQGVALGERVVYYTTNGGDKWERAVFGKNCIHLEYFSEDYEATPRNIFVSNDSGLLISYDDGRVLKSADSARSWCDFIRPGQIEFESGANQPQYFTNLYFQSDEHGWGLGWDRFLYRTKDNGKNWIRVTSDVRFDSMSFSHDGNGVLVSSAGIFRIASKLTN